ncbi:MAG: hypothetical protein QOH64_117 [Acidimicrobiaceae bacterium]|jgi:hypothetical protein
MDTTARRTWWAVVAFAAWTLFVWVGRIRNVWADASLDTTEKVGSSALATTFVVFASLTLVWAIGRRRAGLPPSMVYLVGTFAAWTTGVWVVRSIGIWLHEHPVGFKLVHTVLAAISITLAVAAVRRLRSASEVDVKSESQTAAPSAGLEELANG